MASALTNSQVNCLLVSMPLEIRYEIYRQLVPERLHFAPYRSGFQLSPCVQPNQNADYRGNLSRTRADMSAWGPHWKCEDIALRFDDGLVKYACTGLGALLTTCKFM